MLDELGHRILIERQRRDDLSVRPMEKVFCGADMPARCDFGEPSLLKLLNEPIEQRPMLAGAYLANAEWRSEELAHRRPSSGRHDYAKFSVREAGLRTCQRLQRCKSLCDRLHIKVDSALNRPVEDWGKLLGDTASVGSMLDRLLHHGHVLKCGPRSWRTKTAVTEDRA
jgi:IstB-like ATP binding protein